MSPGCVLAHTHGGEGQEASLCPWHVGPYGDRLPQSLSTYMGHSGLLAFGGSWIWYPFLLGRKVPHQGMSFWRELWGLCCGYGLCWAGRNQHLGILQCWGAPADHLSLCVVCSWFVLTPIVLFGLCVWGLEPAGECTSGRTSACILTGTRAV